MPKSLLSSAVTLSWQLRNIIVQLVGGDTPNLSTRQLAIMLTVYRSDALFSVKDLAKELSLSKPAVTRALDRLTHFGLVFRTIDPDDRRRIHVNRSRNGRRFIKALAHFAAHSAVAPI